MKRKKDSIRVGVVGLGNCASSFIEGLSFYRQYMDCNDGLLFPRLAGFTVRDIDVVLAFDVSSAKVNRPIPEAMYQPPNNFRRIEGITVSMQGPVLRGPTMDGNPSHLASLVPESDLPPVDVAQSLINHYIHVVVNLLPTGSIEATEFYANASAKAGCAFINCIPTLLAQKQEFQNLFVAKQLPLLGDDIKSQIGTTILHRILLKLLGLRGAKLLKTTQINVGGNTDFLNFTQRAETKLVSKRKSLAQFVQGADFHVGHHFDKTRGPYKNAYIDIEATVFAGSSVKISLRLDSDDKPNAAGSISDLVRIGKWALDNKIGGSLREPCAFYMKSPPTEMDDIQCFEAIQERWIE